MEIFMRQHFKGQEEGGGSDKQVYGGVPVTRTEHRLSIGYRGVVRMVTSPRA